MNRIIIGFIINRIDMIGIYSEITGSISTNLTLAPDCEIVSEVEIQLEES